MSRKRLPPTFEEFVKAFPEMGAAWEALGSASRKAGPLDARTCQLLKLAVAIGARAEGAAHSAVRQARAAGASREELFQVALLAASTIGLPNAVAAYTWIRDELGAPAAKSRARRR